VIAELLVLGGVALAINAVIYGLVPVRHRRSRAKDI
jgi:hypothetical protein